MSGAGATSAAVSTDVKFFKKEPENVIPIEIITAHNTVMAIINNEINNDVGAVAEYSETVKNFYKFIADVTNIGLGNENGQMGYFNDDPNDMSLNYENIFEYVISNDPYSEYTRDAATEIGEFLINCGFKRSEDRMAAHGCTLKANEFVWAENTILFCI